jgi:hypothetical protein
VVSETNNTEVKFTVPEAIALQIIELVTRELHVLPEVRRLSPPFPGKLIFMSYRRNDTGDICGRIYDHLLAAFGKEAVFRDLEAIPPGEDFTSVIEKNAAACDVMLVVIGPNWLSDANKARLNQPGDFLRTEVAIGLGRGDAEVAVIPVVVNSAPFPRKEDLPPDLQALVLKNAVFITTEHFTSDMRLLIEAIERRFEG